MRSIKNNKKHSDDTSHVMRINDNSHQSESTDGIDPSYTESKQKKNRRNSTKKDQRSASFLDRFSFARLKPKQSHSERIRAQRNRTQVRSWITSITIIGTTFTIALCVALGIHQKIYASVKEKVIQLSGHIGLDVRDVFIEGRRHLPLNTVLSAAHVSIKHPMLSYNIDEICENLHTIDWIKAATVQRRFPNTLYIRLTEREPIALWQQPGFHYLVDKEGVVIKSPITDVFKTLPIVVGSDAPAHTPKMLSLLEQFITVRKHLTAMIRVRERRWDLTIDHTITVRLPENGIEDALARLSILLDENKIVPGQATIVDLRIPKQVIMRLTPEAAIRVKIRGKEKV